MRSKFLLPFFLFFSCSFSTARAQADINDSLALVDLYNSTNGPGWIDHTNWLTAAPVSTWFGVTVTNQRVTSLILYNNNLIGAINPSLSNLTQLTWISFQQNQLTGNIPGSFGNLPNAVFVDFSNNQLSGAVPASLANLPQYCTLDISHNNYIFNGLEFFVNSIITKTILLTCKPEGDIPIHSTGNVLAVSAGGTLSNNTYRWYKDDVLVATKTGDSTYTIDSPGNYSVEVSNSIVTTNPIISSEPLQLILYSSSNASPQDSMALVDLYNSTNGPGWINHHNWLSVAPLSTWYGVTVRRGKVTSLDLSGNNLSGGIPASFGDLSKLSFLSSGSNKLTGEIPSSFGNLGSLTYMELEHNQLTGSIPSSMGNLSNLTSMLLSDNQLNGAIPPALGNLNNLVQLFLTKNQLSGSIPPELGRLSKLGALDISFNQLTGKIPDSLFNLKTLTGLYLNDNQLTGTISDSVSGLSILGRLRLSNNQLSGGVPQSLENMSELREIGINGNQLSGALPSFVKLTKLYRLFVQDNKFTFSALQNLPVTHDPLIYSPQANIPLNRNGNLFSVSAGGSLPDDTFRLYKNGVLNMTQVGDSSFVITTPGQYYVTVTNKIATKLTLQTDTSNVAGLILADSTSSATQNISGSNAIDVVDTPYHKLILTVTPTPGVNALSGQVNCKVILDSTINNYNGQAYVQRHYDILPANNASIAMAMVTLYFTQQDFDNFNASPTHGLDLPTSPADAAGIANLRVYQYHGFSATSLPGSYSGPAVEIDPADVNIVWNSNGQYWEVSFDVNGFSGFFVSSLNNALLPVKLISFTGKLQDNGGLLQWVTATEINSSYFELQRSVNGYNFSAISTIPAVGNSNNTHLNYQYTDQPKTAGVYYYRLKMADKDARFTYSNVIKLNYAVDKAAVSVYPNPANKSVLVNFPQTTASTILKMIDMTGRVVKTVSIPKATMQLRLNLNGLPAGIYKLISDSGTNTINCSLVVE